MTEITLKPAADEAGIRVRLKLLVEDYRARCLWFLRTDYLPETREEILRTLDYIERYGDREGFVRAGEIRSWLSRHSRRIF